MQAPAMNERLSRISTLWTLFERAHGAETKAAVAAQHLLLQRYLGAVYCYVLGGVRNPEVAEDLTQEFVVRFLRGDFRRASPERGRFRDYLKTTLQNLVNDHFRELRCRPQLVRADLAG